MTLWLYVCLLAKSAWRHSIEWSHASIFLVLAVLGCAALLLSRVGLNFDTSAIRELIEDPKTYGILLVLVVFTRLFSAPYWVWKEEYARREKAEDAIKPHGKLTLLPDIIHEEGESKCCLVLVENCGGHNLTNCQVIVDNYLVCRPFVLRPGERRHVAIFHFHTHDVGAAAITPWSNSTGVWAMSPLRLRLQSSNYVIKLVADDASQRSMVVRAALTDEWTVNKVSL